jgi:prolyl-tRNA editing enzyme YbaK/EbsC (Cys-tRNA(Pro) deacylase)
MTATHTGIDRVRKALEGNGLTLEVEEFPASTRTAADAALAVGCEVGQIAKSLVFRDRDDGEPVLVVTSGSNRVDVDAVARQTGRRLEMADPGFVRERTGFAIGGVPPLAHATPITIYLDNDLLRHDRIWAAAGSGNAVFALSPDQLLRVTGGTAIDVE